MERPDVGGEAHAPDASTTMAMASRRRIATVAPFDSDRDGIASEQTLMQDLDARPFRESELDEPPLQLVVRKIAIVWMSFDGVHAAAVAPSGLPKRGNGSVRRRRVGVRHLSTRIRRSADAAPPAIDPRTKAVDRAAFQPALSVQRSRAALVLD